MALIANCNRDPKRTPNPYKASDFLRAEAKPAPVRITDEARQIALLKTAFPT